MITAEIVPNVSLPVGEVVNENESFPEETAQSSSKPEAAPSPSVRVAPKVIVPVTTVMCPKCSKAVYFAEQVKFLLFMMDLCKKAVGPGGKMWHRACLACVVLTTS